MRTHAALRILPLLFVLTSPLLLSAQFQAPTPEELKMTDDPKAPGAAAIYLNIDESTDDNVHFHKIYARIKVLTEKGKELATVEIPYEHHFTKILDIEGRTIHSDGTIIPLAVKPEDLMATTIATKSGETVQINHMVFTLPNVEAGSILEYHYSISYDDMALSSPEWLIQRKFYVHKAHYSFLPFKAFLPGILNSTNWYPMDEHGHPANNLVWIGKLPDGVTVKRNAAGRFTLDVDEIPAAPEEEWMPPVQSALDRVFFYYAEADTVQNFWNEEGKIWSKDVDRFADPSKTLKEAVAALVAPADSDVDKARKIYLAVQALDNTDFSRTKSDAERKRLNLKDTRHAQDIWEQKSGSSEEIALLYLAMLRAAGLTAYAEKLVDRQWGVFDPSYFTAHQLNDTLVVLSAGGKEIELDPGEKMCPFQTVSWRHSAAGGISQTASGANTVSSANQIYSANKITRFGDITLDDHGGVSGGFKIAMIGQEALYWRQLALRNDEDEVKKRFDQSLQSIVPDGIEAHIDHFAGLDDPNANLIAVVKAQGSMGVATSKRVILPAFFFETRAKHPFVAEEKRQTKVDMHYGETILEQMTYHLPAGLSVEGAPADANESWPQHAIFNTKATVAPGQVTVVRKFYRNFTFAQPEEYQELRGFYQKVATADQGEVVLTTAPVAPKGN